MESHFSIQSGSRGYALQYQIIWTLKKGICKRCHDSKWILIHSSEKAVTLVILAEVVVAGGCGNKFRMDFLVGSGDNWNVWKQVRRVDTETKQNATYFAIVNLLWRYRETVYGLYHTMDMISYSSVKSVKSSMTACSVNSLTHLHVHADALTHTEQHTHTHTHTHTQRIILV